MSNSFYKKVKDLFCAHTVVFLCFLFTLFAAIISRCSLIDPLKFFVVQVCFVYIPGVTLQRLIGINYENKLVRGLVSYLFGYALSIIIYLALLMTSVQENILYFYGVVFLLSGVYLIFQKQSCTDGELEKNEMKWFSLVLLGVLITSCLLFQCANITPMLKRGNVFINQDLVFWMRNTVAVTKGYPVPELSIVGLDLYYHYFSSVHLAFLKFTTGIELFDLCFVYSYLLTDFILVSGLYIVTKKLMGQMRLTFIAIIFVLFTVNLDQFTDVAFNRHIFKASFGFAEGMGFFSVTLYFYLRMLKNEDARWRLFLVSMFLLFMTTGLKGPLGAVLLVGFFIGSVIMMFKYGRIVYGLVSGVGLLVAFLIPLVLFVMNFHAPSMGEHSSLSISATDTVFHSHYFESFYNYLIGVGLWDSLAYIIIVVCYLLSVFLIPFLVFLCTFKKRSITDEDIVVVAMVIVGTLLGLFVSQAGMSQIYFLFIALVLMFLLVFYHAKEHICDIKRLKIVFAVGFLLFCLNYYNSAISCAASVIRTFVPGNSMDETGLTINKEEMEGLRWGRSNIPEDAVLLSNKVLFDMGSRSFWVSSLTERQAFFESYDYSNVDKKKIEENCELIESFYKADENAYKHLRQNGVTHAIVFKGCQQNQYPSCCSILFENDDITIIEL